MRTGILCLSALPGLCGCGTKPVGSDEDLKKAFSQKTFDINSVPPEQRDRVRALMESQKAMKK